MLRTLHPLPTPTPRLLMGIAVGLLPAAFAWVSPLSWRIACAMDATLVLLYVIDVVLWRSEPTFGIVFTVPKRVARGARFKIAYTLHNITPRKQRITWRHDLPETLDPPLHTGTLVTGAGDSTEWHVQATAQKRGQLRLDAPVIAYDTPLRLGNVRVISEPLTISVLPATLSLQRFDTLMRLHRQQDMGVVAARQRGDGSEIVGLRPYQIGDPLTRIDWKATARADGNLITREVQAERRQNIVLMLDCGRRMAGEISGRSRLDYAVEAALLLAHVAQRTDDKVGLVAFSDHVQRVVQPLGKTAGAATLAGALFDLECVLREPPYTAVAAQVAAHFRRRSLMVLFTDAAEPASLAALERPIRFLGERHLVVCVIFSDVGALETLTSAPDDVPTLYRMGAAAELLVERSQAVERLRRAGALIVDTPPDQLTTAVVNRYLEVKARHLL